MRSCKVEDCDGPAASRGMCWMHCGRWRRNGDPLASGRHGGHNRGVGEPCQVPDPTPAIRLRKDLARRRANGEPFRAAWRSALAAVDAPDWRAIFEDQRRAWADAYLRAGKPAMRPSALTLESPENTHVRSGPPVLTTGARHDGPSLLDHEPPPWCR